jgi:small conductance mechanosensitive channel
MLEWIFNDRNIAEFIIISVATLVLAYVVDWFFGRFLKNAALILRNDPSKYRFIRHFLRAIIYIAGFGWAISEVPYLKTLSSSFIAGAGVLAVALGLASQQALSNIVAGLFIIIFKPFRINDRLKINKDTLLQGIVEDITLRHTVIRDFENRRIVIPNAVMSQEIIINSDLAEDKIIKYIEINISFEADIDHAKAIMRDEIQKHPFQIDPRDSDAISENEPEIPVRVIAIGEYFLTLRAWACAQNSPNAFILYCDLLESIKKRFDKEGIKFPYPNREISINGK